MVVFERAFLSSYCAHPLRSGSNGKGRIVHDCLYRKNYSGKNAPFLHTSFAYFTNCRLSDFMKDPYKAPYSVDTQLKQLRLMVGIIA